jgi:EAL domain-containing protein (putative c-di-GMP-specific phosphodiesterase class I)
MICIITRNVELRVALSKLLSGQQVGHRVLETNSDLALPAIYAPGVTAVITDPAVPLMATDAWLDMLASLGHRVPVFLLGSADGDSQASKILSSETVAWIENADPEMLMSLLEVSGALGSGRRSSTSQGIPLYNAQVPFHLLRGNGALSMLTINASGFRKIGIEYGVEAYQKLQDCLYEILAGMWGQPGNFRRNDIIMRRSARSNTYFVFLEQSRISKVVPAPGVLEKLADRVALKLQELLWNEIFKPKASRILPDCINQLPEISVGHATVLHNPCVDTTEILEQLIELSGEVSKLQLRRIKDREREIMQSIVQSREILYPNYQAVFHLPQISKDLAIEVKNAQSIGPIKDLLYGFESLIRARKEIVETKLSGEHLVALDARLLRPDILFGLASHSKVALELDQVCLLLGINGAVTLPGKLMVNILPRNLMHLERLSHLISARGRIIFEISESERVSNPEKMLKVLDYIAKIGGSIAADDFGKGHGSIERVIKLRPEIIKLDRSLVENIHKDATKKIFAEGVVKAAKLVNAKVLAEGVELWEEAQCFKDMGVDFIQGFLLHKPQPLEDILSQLGATDADQTKMDSVA